MSDTASFWDAHYGARDQRWSGAPNAALVQELADAELTPGSALDLGCGEGGDAIWLAARGWTVTGVDVSRTALDRAERAAEAAGVEVSRRIEWRRHDLTVTFPVGRYDLVSAQFLQSPIADFPADRILRRAAGAVAEGGTLLIVTHAGPPAATHQAHEHSGGHGRVPDPVEVAAALGLDQDPWDLVVCERRTRVAPPTGPDGQPAAHVDGVIRARLGRRP